MRRINRNHQGINYNNKRIANAHPAADAAKDAHAAAAAAYAADAAYAAADQIDFGKLADMAVENATSGGEK